MTNPFDKIKKTADLSDSLDNLKKISEGFTSPIDTLRQASEGLLRPLDIVTRMDNILKPVDTIFTARDFSLPTSTTNPAKWTYERLAKYINDFEKKLDNEHEVGARLVTFGSDTTFHIEDMGYWGPDIICFHGINENQEKIQLIQNISQLSVLLVSMKKLKEKPRRIGFDLSQKIEKQKE